MRRAGATLVALICWAGLAIQFSATFESQHHWLPTLWVLLRFFTVITNLAVAITMTWVAIGRRASATWLGGVTLAMLLVGTIYMTLLRGLIELSGGALLADTLLHKVSPVLMGLWWLFFAPRSQLKWSAALWWSVYPVTYLIYAMVRAHYDHKYPYPFIDVGQLGWAHVGLNVGGIALVFIAAGLGLIWLDTWRPLGLPEPERRIYRGEDS